MNVNVTFFDVLLFVWTLGTFFILFISWRMSGFRPEEVEELRAEFAIESVLRPKVLDCDRWPRRLWRVTTIGLCNVLLGWMCIVVFPSPLPIIVAVMVMIGIEWLGYRFLFHLNWKKFLRDVEECRQYQKLSRLSGVIVEAQGESWRPHIKEAELVQGGEIIRVSVQEGSVRFLVFLPTALYFSFCGKNRKRLQGEGTVFYTPRGASERSQPDECDILGTYVGFRLSSKVRKSPLMLLRDATLSMKQLVARASG